MMRTFSVVVLAVVCSALAGRADASTLDEWVLPAGTVELDVDASLGPQIAFVQGPTGRSRRGPQPMRANRGVRASWSCQNCAATAAGSIVALPRSNSVPLTSPSTMTSPT